MRKRRATAATRRFELDPAKLAEVLSEVMPIGDGKEPASVIGWFDRQSRPRRLRADYPNGWRLEVRISVKGHVTSSAASIRMKTALRGADAIKGEA